MLTENLTCLDAGFHPVETISRTYRPVIQSLRLRLAALASQVIAFFRGVDFIETDEEGRLQPSKERLEKLQKELQELKEAEQYVLKTRESGTYPCYPCRDKKTIRLKPGQIWKYGTTTKGEKGRYQDSLEELGLNYFIEFQGTILECLEQEKQKIYFYAVHPENITRQKPLIRPPGNKNDR